MRKKKFIWVCMAAMLALVIGFSAFWKTSAQPVYEGQPLSIWLDQLERESNQGNGNYTIRVPSAEAIRRILQIDGRALDQGKPTKVK